MQAVDVARASPVDERVGIADLAWRMRTILQP
jgi:hypothetical protein